MTTANVTHGEGAEMLVKKLAAGSMALATVVLGLNVATVSPAAAAPGSWRAYPDTNPVESSNSLWACGTTSEIGSGGVSAQACAIRSANNDFVQAAVIVKNRLPHTYPVTAHMKLTSRSDGDLGSWDCSLSRMGRESWSVCFGPTIPHRFLVYVSRASVNSNQLAVSLTG
jgi:hypothetical protein